VIEVIFTIVNHLIGIHPDVLLKYHSIQGSLLALFCPAILAQIGGQKLLYSDRLF
jgi:hypothetical protein